MEKSYRIHTNIINDTVLNVNMQQDYDFLEVLTMKLRQKDAYRLHSSNYGVIIGRVLANDAFGIPNARVSVFIERDTNDPTYMESLYPFSEIMGTDRKGRRYNLLPDYNNDDCYRIVGTFPNKRLVLDDDVSLEIYDKYWKFTTVTNSAGDYMIFGVPSGSQQIHVDIDLSDIGILSQTPRDFEYKGYTMSMFDSPKQFKESTNLDSLAQIFSQNKSVFVYPFWGDEDLGNGIAAITRCDVQIQYKFEPTCVFMGAIVSDNEGNSIGHSCSASIDNGFNDQLVTGEGTIEMIRKTTDGLTEEYSIQGNQLIDSDGVWCYQIPMNLDYIATDEYGNVIPTDNPNKGIPTRTRVRFRISKYETGDEGFSRHTAKYLVPMNPTLVNRGNNKEPSTEENGEYIERMYSFGSSTPEDCFRDLYWNNVYSVKNYIPKVQTSNRAASPYYTGLKGSNLATNQNPIPFNKLRIDIPFMYAIMCIIFEIIGLIVSFINKFIIGLINLLISIVNFIAGICIPLIAFDFCPFGWGEISYVGCISLGSNLSDDNTAFYPGCDYLDASSCPSDMKNCKKRASLPTLMNLVQQKLAQDYKIIKLDFYQDWLNGTLYMPLWYWRKRKKKTFLFWTVRGARNDYCSCDTVYSRLKSYVTCAIAYTNKKLGVSDGVLPEGEDNWHKSSNRAGKVGVRYGLIKGVENKDGLTAYYYTAIQPTSSAGLMPMKDRKDRFPAFRLFATDIILLGNLNENNLYGLPQLFKALPSTTVNIPPIATITEEADDSEAHDGKNVLSDEETGQSQITGMDWIDGGGTPTYSEGLFMLLECTYAETRAKSCINVERLSELGMNLDMRYKVSYPTSSGLEVGIFEPDGLITKYELDDTDNRAMFATMNHLGFVPQSYQSSKTDFNETQVLDERTNYYIPKFKFLYPTDLDGRMSPLVERYKKGFKQIMSDDRDNAYINFRLGDTQPNNKEGLLTNGLFYDNNKMPLYNNSFYFYFGVKKGNTAIDKFNKMFFAECFKNSKKPFSMKIDSRPKSYCQRLYKNDGGDSLIKFYSDDIETPYSYELFNYDGISVQSSIDYIYSNTFEIKGVDNGIYTLRVTDANGKHIDERIDLFIPNITISYETRNLGTKYYDDESIKSDICTNDLYGKITFNRLYIDGYEFGIGSNTHIVEESDKIIKVEVYANIINTDVFSGQSNFYAGVMEFSLLPELEGNVKDSLCSETEVGHFFTGASQEVEGSYVFGFNVYKPNTFFAKLTQVCLSEGNVYFEVTSNTSSYSIEVENGKNFYAYLNTMPVKFMIDKKNDIELLGFNDYYFYPPKNDEIHLLRWLGMHNETSYKFPDYRETELWADFINIIGDKSEDYYKNEIIKYKFSRIFNISNAVYVIGDSGNRFQYTADGGIQPLLYRSCAPYYADEERITTSFVFNDDNYVVANPNYPNIVGFNYQDGNPTTLINGLYKSSFREHLGNYFMVASNNGRYVNNYSGNCEIYSVQIPENSAVNIEEGEWKMLGEEKVLNILEPIIYEGGSNWCGTLAKPYFNAMFVDRRLDFDLTVFGPLFPSSFPNGMELGDDEERKNKITHIGVFGKIYNGVEMAYDENYNIISVNVTTAGTISEDGEIIPIPSGTSASVNKTLEYSYQYSSGNDSSMTVQTVYRDVLDSRWKDYGDKINQLIRNKIPRLYYDNERPQDNQPILRTFYSAVLQGYDIRQLFWSTNNESAMTDVVNSDINTWVENDNVLPFYIDKLDEILLPGKFNGDFSGNAYPTMRYLDIRKIKPTSNFSLSITSCSYEIEPELDYDRNLITAKAGQGDTVKIEFEFGSLKPSPKGDKESYGHFRYVLPSDDSSSAQTVEMALIMLGMNYKEVDYGNFDVYSHPMALITIDKVLTIKSWSNYSGMLVDWLMLYNTYPLSSITVNSQQQIMEENEWSSTDTTNYDRSYPYSIDSATYICYGEKKRRLTADDTTMQQCRIGCTRARDYNAGHSGTYYSMYQNGGIEASSVFGDVAVNKRFIAACSLRHLKDKGGTNLTRNVNLFEVSDFYDCRNIKVKFEYELKSSPKRVKFKLIIYQGDNEEFNKSINYKNILNCDVVLVCNADSYTPNYFNMFLKVDEDFIVTIDRESNIIKIDSVGDEEGYVTLKFNYKETDVYAKILNIFQFFITLNNGAIYEISKTI